MRRIAIEQRNAAYDRSETFRTRLRAAEDEIRKLQGRLRACESDVARLERELAPLRVREAQDEKLKAEHAWLAAHVDRVRRGFGKWPPEVKAGFVFLSPIGRYAFGHLAWFIGGPRFDQVRRWKRKIMSQHKLAENKLDGSEASLGALLPVIQKALMQWSAEAPGGTTFTMCVDALAATPALGVSRDGRVSGTVREVQLDEDEGETICSDPAVFEDFMRLQAGSKNLAGALFVWSLTLDAIGSPVFPICVTRRASGKADHSVLSQSEELLRIARGFRLPVTRVASDGDRTFVTLLGPAWLALQDFSRWVFAMPVMAQENLIAAVLEPWDCLKLSDIHHLLKVMRYRALIDALFASIASGEALLRFGCSVWRRMDFPPAMPSE